MPDQQDDDRPPRRGIFAAEDPDANPLVIMASYAATVAIVGLIVGAACVLVPYLVAMSGSNAAQARRGGQQVLNHDSGTFANWRFWIGAAAGAGGTIGALVVLNLRWKRQR